MFYKILIEPAKSSKSKCKKCDRTIDQNTLRIKVVDALKFNEFIRKEGRHNLSGQGLSRGYFECVGPRGQNISIEKYFVHMMCYEPIEPHPFEKQYFDPQHFKAQHKEQFEEWLKDRNNSNGASEEKKEKKEKKSGKKAEETQLKKRSIKKTKGIKRESKVIKNKKK